MGGRKYEDDDGYTVADMSGIEKKSLLFPTFPARHRKQTVRNQETTENSWEEHPQPLSRKERRMYIFAVWKASFLIGLVYVVGIGLLILLLLFLWGN